MRTALYRHFDINGALLYVGISLDAVYRYRQHIEDEKCWTDDIVNMTIEWLHSREEAIEAERLAITCENPIWNIAFNKRPPETNSKRLKKVKIKNTIKKRKRYSKKIENDLKSKIKYSCLEIEQEENYLRARYSRWNIKFDKFEVGQRHYIQEIGGRYSRSCSIFTILAVEDHFLIVKYDNREDEEIIIRGGNTLALSNFIHDLYFELTEEEEKLYAGIDLKRSIQECGYDPRHFNEHKTLNAKVIALCPDCSSYQEGFLEHYYNKNKPSWLGHVRTPCDWH